MSKFKTTQIGVFIFAIFMVFGCNPSQPNADEIVQKAIKTHGGDLYENSLIDFDFRDRHYRIERNEGAFKYHRIFEDSLGTYHDVLDNNGFSRTVNDEAVNLDQEWVQKYSASVNSVAYFALLPFGLNDAAVHKELLGKESIRDKAYYKIKVTFSEDGGGEDHDDVFVYWFDTETFRMDYFGYSYHTEGGGIRFREAVNVREVGGVTFADYINYAGQHGDTDVSGLTEKFINGELKKLSEINLENIVVSRYL